MPHDATLLTSLAIGFALAFAFGLLATRLRLPPILGYLIAGVLVGPFTPGYVADSGFASQMAEIGVILLMFGVGLHFSIDDLLAVRSIAVPGAIAQIVVATMLGSIVAVLWGWSWSAGLVFGLCLSVASTVVLLRTLEDRGMLQSADGRIAVGWLIVEDLVTVLVLVLLPAIAGATGAHAPALEAASATTAEPSVLRATIVTIVKITTFIAVMLIGGRRVIPLLLGWVVRTGSRELFTLAVMAVALGIAVGAAVLFDVSFALGAFFAGVIVSESAFSHEAAANALPLRDAFAVLFFVSVGMLFDPVIIVRQPLQVLSVVLIIVAGKSLAAFGIVLLFRRSLHTALVISASLAQIGEFSFILAALASELGMIPRAAQGLVVAGALLSITLNPAVFALLDFAWRRWGRTPAALAIERPSEAEEGAPPLDEEALRDHVVIVGAGRVGEPVARELREHGIPLVLVEASRDVGQRMRELGFPVIIGDATRLEVLERAHLERAKLVIVAAPDAYAARSTLAHAHQLNPGVEVIVRTHSDGEREFLETMGATRALMAERELAVSLTREALRRFLPNVEMEEVAARVLGTPLAANESSADESRDSPPPE